MGAETSADVASIASRGLTDPADLDLDEIQTVCASALRQREPDENQEIADRVLDVEQVKTMFEKELAFLVKPGGELTAFRLAECVVKFAKGEE